MVFLENGWVGKSDVIFSDPFVLTTFSGEVVKVTGLDRGRGRKWVR